MNSPENGDRASLEREFECYSAMITIQETFQEIYEIMAVDLGTLARNITSVIDATKKITDIAVSIKNVELQESILELRNQLVDIKTSLIEAKEENFELKQENKTLKEQLIESEKPKTKKLVFHKSFYYEESDASFNNPYCPNCYEGSKELRHLVEGALLPQIPSFLKCPKCSTQYGRSR